MSGETDLAKLLSGMSPALDPLAYAFASIAPEQVTTYADDAWMVCKEDEGVTLIMPISADTADIFADKPRFRRITLRVHSSLHAVGLTAAVSHVLADQGIPANMVAGFYHDHVFVPENQAIEAMSALASVMQGTPAGDG
ncbi:MAG: ACT domain-containing protein [Pseudomonadota bacterium]